MKCVNCRCVIPDASPYCIYCGHVAYHEGAPIYPVYNSPYHQTLREGGVYHRYADYDDPNRFYGIPEENDGSDAYDYYYDEIKYDEQLNYLAKEQDRKSGLILSGTDRFIGGMSAAKLLWCIAGLDCVIILLLLIIMLLMML